MQSEMIQFISTTKSIAVLAVVGSGMIATAETSEAAQILQIIILGVSGWTLLEVIKQGKEVAQMKQKLRDLPCGESCHKHKPQE